LLGIGCQQDHFAGQLRGDHQKVLVWEQNDLSPPVTAFFPGSFSRGQIEASEDADIEAVGVSVVDDEIRKFRLELRRLPSLFDLPCALISTDLNEGDAVAFQGTDH